MKIIPISFIIAASELTSQPAEQVEELIKQAVLDHVMKEISPMLDDENFIEMSPSEDGSEFTININLMIGSTNQYIDATAEVAKNLKGLSIRDDLISKATQPLIDLVK